MQNVEKNQIVKLQMIGPVYEFTGNQKNINSAKKSNLKYFIECKKCYNNLFKYSFTTYASAIKYLSCFWNQISF